MAEQNMQDYENMSEAELEFAMKEAERAMLDPMIAKTMNESMAIMDRFMRAMEEFAMKHPEESERIMDIMDEYSPQEDMY